MIIDFIPIQENGVSIRLPRVADALRVFLIFRATQRARDAASGARALDARDVSGHGGRAVHLFGG